MRLLDTRNFKLETFIGNNIPPYAILSHTWGDDEVLFEHMRNGSQESWGNRTGAAKVINATNEAKRNGYHYIWIDTCCIDKSSSAELSEAINSMFDWYQNSKVCYAYMADVINTQGITSSRWFTRGWTLQELLAPGAVTFYSKDWTVLGSKASLASIISKITTIEQRFLQGDDIQTTSISKRMSWASSRNTTRKEDTAYCLLGLFDINMPMIYGEGFKAFIRLQEEIIKKYPQDHTLFAWGDVVTQASIPLPKYTELHKLGPFLSNSKELKGLLGLLADHPRDFEHSGHFVPRPDASDFYNPGPRGANPRKLESPPFPTIRGKETVLHLPIRTGDSWTIRGWDQPAIATACKFSVCVLLCCHENHPNVYVELPLIHCGRVSYGRTRDIVLQPQKSSTMTPYIWSSLRKRISIAPQPALRANPGDLLFRRRSSPSLYPCVGIWIPVGVEFLEGDGHVKTSMRTSGPLATFWYELDEGRQLGLEFGRSAPQNNQELIGSLIVGIRPKIPPDGEKDFVSTDNIEWRSFWDPDDTYQFSHTMVGLFDIWTLDLPTLPKLRIGAARMAIGSNTNGVVDVVDVVVLSQSELEQDSTRDFGGSSPCPETKHKLRL